MCLSVTTAYSINMEAWINQSLNRYIYNLRMNITAYKYTFIYNVNNAPPPPSTQTLHVHDEWMRGEQ